MERQRTTIDSENQTLSKRALELEQAMNERGDDLPPLHILIRYSPHGTARDAEGIKEAIEMCDIFIPEGMGWTTVSVRVFKDVSDGVLAPSKACKLLDLDREEFSFIHAELEALHGKQKKVGFIDIPLTSLTAIDFLKLVSESQALDIPKAESIDDLIVKMRARVEAYADSQKKREDFMLKAFDYEIHSLIAAYPELKGKKELNILISMGTLHTRVYHELRGDESRNVKRSHQNNPEIYGFLDEGTRRRLFDIPLDDELVCRIALEGMLSSFVYHFISGENTDSKAITSFLRKWIQSLTKEEMVGVLTISEYAECSWELLNCLYAKEGFNDELKKLIGGTSEIAKKAYEDYVRDYRSLE